MTSAFRGGGGNDKVREVAWIYSTNILLNLDKGEGGRGSKNPKIFIKYRP